MEEKEAWCKDVDVYWQQKAWADTTVSVNWAETTLSQLTKDEDRFVLFCDNLTAQQSVEFKETIAKQGGVVWFGLPNATDLWQVVDAGPGQLVKVLIGQAQRQWLEDDANSELWYGHERGLTAKDRRVLITHWAGEAWNKFVSEEYDSFRLKAWQKTGCLMTADGTDDDLVKPEGLEG